MAYELINNAQINPLRLHALVRLVSANPGINEDKIFSLLQPAPLNSNQSAVKELLDAGVKTKLIVGDDKNKYKAKYSYKELETYSSFRILMQKLTLGVIKEEKDNYLLNLFAAWYAVNDSKYLTKEIDTKKISVDFNTSLYPNSQTQVLNPTKLGGMDDWLIFLGFGWKLNKDYFLIPDATQRLESLLEELLPKSGDTLFKEFITRLSKLCPELDRGALFEKCWQAVYGNRQRSNQISLMLSTALRALQARRRIKLITTSDARDKWELYPDMTDSTSNITHISIV